MKPICVKCQRFYRMTKSGYYFLEQMPTPAEVEPDDDDGPRYPLPGTAEPDRWEPYKLWSGDLWTCEGCGHQLVSGVGRGPIAEHYQPEFADVVTRLGADQLTVNDC